MYSGISKIWNKVPDIQIFLDEINEPVTDRFAKSYRTHSEYPLLVQNTSRFSFILEHLRSTVPIS